MSKWLKIRDENYPGAGVTPKIMTMLEINKYTCADAAQYIFCTPLEINSRISRAISIFDSRTTNTWAGNRLRARMGFNEISYPIMTLGKNEFGGSDYV